MGFDRGLGAKAVLDVIAMAMDGQAEEAADNHGTTTIGATTIDSTIPHAEQREADVDIAHTTTDVAEARRDHGIDLDCGSYAAKITGTMFVADNMPLGVFAMPIADRSLNMLSVRIEIH